MALTRELLVANAALSGLTDEQLRAIETLSQNDENSVIAKKTGEIYGALDMDILTVSGVEKNGTEKTYDYAKRVLGDFKAKVDSISGLQSEISTLTKEKARLEKAIADGSADAETAKQLKQAKADLANVTSQFAELNNKYNSEKEAHEKQIFGIRVDNELQSASASLKFKAGLPESVVKVILQQASDKVKSMNPGYIDDGKGGQILAYKDESGAIMRNPNNQLNPYTTGELLMKELDGMGVIDKGRQQTGGGTDRGGRGNEGGVTIDVSGCRTRTEAYDAIRQSLLQQGMTVGSEKFESAMKQAWTDNNVSSLPER